MLTRTRSLVLGSGLLAMSLCACQVALDDAPPGTTRGGLRRAPRGQSSARGGDVVSLAPLDDRSELTGFWTDDTFCRPGTWAVGFSQQVESWQGGSSDDRALTSISLLCGDERGGDTELVTPYESDRGSWGSEVECVGGVLTGARLKIEPPQGGGDDTGCNAVHFACSGDLELQADNDARWGSFGEWTDCAPDEAVCGVSLFVDSVEPDGDETGMNALDLLCCPL